MKRSMFTLKKIFILLCIIFCLFTQCSTVAFATWESLEPTTANVEALIPDELSLDIKESEYGKTEEEVKSIITSMLKMNGIIIDNLEVSVVLGNGDVCEGCPCALANEVDAENDFGIYNVKVNVVGENTKVSKDITLSYSNTEDTYVNENSLTAEINLVKDLNMDKRLKNVEFADPFEFFEQIRNEIETYYVGNLETDDSTTISVKCEYQTVGVNIHARYDLAIFENDTLSEVKFLGSLVAVPIIDVPGSENMTDEELQDCVSQTFPEFGENITDISTGWKDCENDYSSMGRTYTIAIRDAEGNIVESWILIRTTENDETTILENAEETTEPLIVGDELDTGQVLETEKVSEENTNYSVYFETPKEAVKEEAKEETKEEKIELENDEKINEKDTNITISDIEESSLEENVEEIE